MAQDVTYYGSWTQVPYVDLPKTGGGDAVFTDVSDTTAIAADVNSTKYFYTANGTRVKGTSAGGTALQEKTVTPSDSQIIVTPDTNYDGLSQVTINAISPSYVGSGINRNTAADLTVSGSSVNVPAGYYASATNKSVATATQATPTISISVGGLITSTVTQEAGYVANGTTSSSFQLPTQPGTTITPTTSAQTIVTSGKYTTGTITVTAIPTEYIVPAGTITISSNGTGIDIAQYASANVSVNAPTINLENKTITPSETKQTITAGSGYDGLGTVTVNAITASYVGSEVTRRSSSDMTMSGATVTAPAGYYDSAGTKTITAATQATPTISINNSGLITSTVTQSAGYVSAGTKSATLQLTTKAAATITPGTTNQTIASGTYLTGAQTIVGDTNLIADNIKKDVTIFGVTGTHEGSSGDSSNMIVATATKTLTVAASSISFTGLSGEPTSFAITSSTDQTTGGTKVIAVTYDGTNLYGIDLTTQAENDTGFTKSYSNGTLTITATTASFQANEYKLVYSYGGTAANIGTGEVQVGSGATSITFTGLEDEPEYFSCIFKSTFSTSSGYQRVMEVVYDGTNTYGHALDSSAHVLSSWSYTYNNGSLTISSTSTNNGGYFHQPGYYQLIYAVGGTVTIDIEPLSVTQNGTYQEAGVAYSPVVVNVSGGGSVSYDTKTVTASNYPVSLNFTSMKGQPKFFVVRLNAQVSSSGNTTYYYIVDIVSNGTTTHGNCFRIGSTRRVDNITSGYSWSYSGTTLTITSSAASRSASPGAFYSGSYELMYAY